MLEASQSLVNASSGPVMMPARSIMGLVKVSFIYSISDWSRFLSESAFSIDIVESRLERDAGSKSCKRTSPTK